jgi:hypothetical protein
MTVVLLVGCVHHYAKQNCIGRVHDCRKLAADYLTPLARRQGIYRVKATRKKILAKIWAAG